MKASHREVKEGETVTRDAYNDGYTHEALHTTHVLMETFANHVIDTRCADEFPDVKRLADHIHERMFGLYQLIGQKFKD